MAQPKIGMQLIVYGKRWQTDLAGVAREIAGAGYDGIETGNLAAFYPVEEVRTILAETGLALMGAHFGFADVANPEKLSAGIDLVCALGGNYLACSGVAPAEGIQAYEQAAVTFNTAGKTCADRGVTFCYHNHAWEFAEFDGEKGIHRLAQRTDPGVVKLCVDVYWVHIGGESPAEFIARYAERIGYFHIKDGGKGRFTELGRGEVNLPDAVNAALRTHPSWLVYEQDTTAKTPEESVKESREYLRRTFGL